MNLTELLVTQKNVDEIKSRFGLTEEQTLEAMAAVIPAFSEGLKRQTSTPESAANFIEALASGGHSRYADDPSNVAAEYGLALALSRAGNHNRALAVTESLRGSDPQNLLYLATHAEAQIQAGQQKRAAQLLAHQLVINPDNPPLTLLYAQALSADERHHEAQMVLERHSRERKDDVNVWYNLAEIAGLAGDTIAVHRARAEFFVLHGSYSRAIQHLEYAQRLVSRTDVRLQAQIDQRIRDLREALMEATS